MDRLVSVGRVDRLVPVGLEDRVAPDGVIANPAALTANDRCPKNRTLPKTVWQGAIIAESVR